jgi:hypothetical protein
MYVLSNLKIADDGDQTPHRHRLAAVRELFACAGVAWGPSSFRKVCRGAYAWRRAGFCGTLSGWSLVSGVTAAAGTSVSDCLCAAGLQRSAVWPG